MNQEGLCACGCGERTKPSSRRPGEMNRFVRGHNSRVAHPNYKGGRVTTAFGGGYVGVLMPDHPRANTTGYVLEHVLVAEVALGRHLPEGVQVHHVNGDPADNRPENLVTCEDQAYHQLLHRRQRALAATGHADWTVRCHFCGEYGPESEMTMRRGTPYGYHAACRRAYRRERRRA